MNNQKFKEEFKLHSLDDKRTLSIEELGKP